MGLDQSVLSVPCSVLGPGRGFKRGEKKHGLRDDCNNALQSAPCAVASNYCYQRATGCHDSIGVPFDADCSRVSKEWLCLLQTGVVMSLQGEPVTVSIDADLHGLQIREHVSVYPWTDFRGSETMQRKAACPADAFELEVSFAGAVPLVFFFDEEDHLSSFANTLESVAHQAQSQVLPLALDCAGYYIADDSDSDAEKMELSTGREEDEEVDHTIRTRMSGID
mmetsp:Transcript_42298/g.111723  ORF Transcript_42298/g.111723 Transcript_42298/m.111723 type:complete len:223 (-) Transcript_42298:18-686(-)